MFRLNRIWHKYPDSESKSYKRFDIHQFYIFFGLIYIYIYISIFWKFQIIDGYQILYCRCEFHAAIVIYIQGVPLNISFCEGYLDSWGWVTNSINTFYCLYCVTVRKAWMGLFFWKIWILRHVVSSNVHIKDLLECFLEATGQTLIRDGKCSEHIYCIRSVHTAHSGGNNFGSLIRTLEDTSY